MKKRIVFLGVIILLMLILSGCMNNESPNSAQEKLISQIEYLDRKIITMLNRLNNISFEHYMVNSREVTLSQTEEEENSENEESSVTVTEMVPDIVLDSNFENVDWDTLKREIELLNSSWPVIVLNLYNMNVNGEDILAFSRDLDISIINIRGQDKRGSLTSLARLYSYLPRYLANIPEEANRRHIMQTKSFILNAYALVEQGNWAEIARNLEEADSAFRNIINDIEYVRNNEFKVNRTYVLLKELQRSLEFRNPEIFYMNYRNLMRSLNTF